MPLMNSRNTSSFNNSKTASCAEAPLDVQQRTFAFLSLNMPDDCLLPLQAALRAKEAGSTRFCMGAAWRGPTQVRHLSADSKASYIHSMQLPHGHAACISCSCCQGLSSLPEPGQHALLALFVQLEVLHCPESCTWCHTSQLLCQKGIWTGFCEGSPGAI